MSDPTDAEEFDEAAKARWPWMPAWMRLLMYVWKLHKEDEE